MKKILVFGGTGFVGSVVVRKALERGYHVVVATRGGVPEMGTPLATLAQRVPLLGGRAAAYEMAGMTLVSDPAQIPTATTASSASAATAAGSSGQPSSESMSDDLAKWARGVEETKALEFVSIDAAQRSQVFHLFHDHADTTAVISTVGLLTRDYAAARCVNGDVNTNIAAGVCHPKLLPNVRKLVYVSAEPYNQYWPSTVGRLIGHRRTLKGYFHGKRIAERAVLDNLGSRGVVLRPGFIYGTRYIPTPSFTDPHGTVMALPLWWIGLPLEKLLTAVHGYNLLTPPIDVEMVAETALRACAWAGLPEKDVSGLVDTYRMQALCAQPDPTQPEAKIAAAPHASTAAPKE